MISTPEILMSSPILVAYLPLVVPSVEIRQHMGPGLMEVRAAIKAQGIEEAGAWLTYHNQPPAQNFDFQICVPVTSKLKPAGRVLCREIPATRVARATYKGGYEGLGHLGWGALMRWLEENKIAYAGLLWEIYQRGPESGTDSASYETELNRVLI